MRTALILLLALAANSAFADTQTVWKWVDERGVTHYSDRPVPGATRVELNVSSRTQSSRAQSSQQTPQPSAQPAPAQSQQPSSPAAAPYRNFEIWKPLPEETVANTGGVVQVNVRIDPALSSQHRMSIYIDGKRAEGFPPGTIEFELRDVPRGTHSVVAIITDPAGKRLQETAPVVFHVRQESVANPPVGPSLRPPPKPRPGNTANKLPSGQPSYAALNGGRKPVDPSTNLPATTRPNTSKGPHSGT